MKENKHTDKKLSSELNSYEEKPKLRFEQVHAAYLKKKSFPLKLRIIISSTAAVIVLATGYFIFSENKLNLFSNNKQLISDSSQQKASLSSEYVSPASIDTEQITNTSEKSETLNDTFPGTHDPLRTGSLEKAEVRTNTTNSDIRNKNSREVSAITESLSKKTNSSSNKKRGPDLFSTPTAGTDTSSEKISSAYNQATEAKGSLKKIPAAKIKKEIHNPAKQNAALQKKSPVTAGKKTEPSVNQNTIAEVNAAFAESSLQTNMPGSPTQKQKSEHSEEILAPATIRQNDTAQRSVGMREPILSSAPVNEVKNNRQELIPESLVVIGDTLNKNIHTEKASLENLSDKRSLTGDSAVSKADSLIKQVAVAAVLNPDSSLPARKKKSRFLISAEGIYNIPRYQFNPGTTIPDSSYKQAFINAQGHNPARFFSGSILLGYSYKKVGINTGLGFINTETAINTETLAHSDSIYNFTGVKKSIVVNGDTIEPGQYVNQVRILTIPIQLNYRFQLFSGKLGIEPQIGIQIGIPLKSRQLVMENDYVFRYEKTKVFSRDNLLFYDLSLKLSYKLNRYADVYLKQGYFFNSKSIYRDNYPVKHTLKNFYSALGISIRIY